LEIGLIVFSVSTSGRTSDPFNGPNVRVLYLYAADLRLLLCAKSIIKVSRICKDHERNGCSQSSSSPSIARSNLGYIAAKRFLPARKPVSRSSRRPSFFHRAVYFSAFACVHFSNVLSSGAANVSVRSIALILPCRRDVRFEGHIRNTDTGYESSSR
jgi:hypothetical protein